MSKPPKATWQDLLKLGDDFKGEIIDGEIVKKEGGSGRHGLAQIGIGGPIFAEYGKRGGNRVGGWWILPETDIELATHQLYIPDIAGWRRERLPELPEQRPVRIVPDWVCEVLSPSNAANDLIKKFRGYHAARVPH